MAGVLEGKRILVTGVRNKWSIVWHTALSLQREGAEMAFSVQSDREVNSLEKLLREAGIEAPTVVCDTTVEGQAEALFVQLSVAFEGKLDGLVHGIASANREDLSGEYVATSKEGYLKAHEISAYSLVALSRGARPLMQAAGGGSIVTLTYLGAERVVPNYNVMGVAKASLEASVRYLASDLGPDNIRVNAISAGPIKTVSAAGIADFDAMLKKVAAQAPLRRNTDPAEVGDSVLFLLSPWGRGITGETLYVDNGYHILGMV